MTKETTLASILKSLLQGQGPIYIQTDDQQSGGLPKVTQSTNHRAQLFPVLATISLPDSTACRQDSRWTLCVN